MLRLLLHLTASVAALALAACTLPGSGTGLDFTEEVDGPTDFAGAWAADYFGNGVGQAVGQPFVARDARLRIALDADSVRLPDCPRCVTVTLDSVFALANVPVNDPVELNLAYDDGPVRYTLLLQRFSGNGSVGNTVSARATVANVGVTTPFFDVTYVLERP